MSKTTIVWFRNDLRVHDHEALSRAAETGCAMVPIYIFDPQQISSTHFGFPKMEYFRASFLLEGLADLRDRLRSLGGDLIIRWGKPEQVMRKLIREVNAGVVYFHSEYAPEEQNTEQKVLRVFAREELKFYPLEGSSLYHPDNLPHIPKETPDVFSQFRKKVEKYSHVRKLLATPTEIRLPKGLESGQIPTSQQLRDGITRISTSKNGVLNFHGGETAALERLENYCGTLGPLKTYKETRNGLLGADYSSKLSPWLAQGSLSPRMVYWKVKAYEEAVIKNQSTYWLIFELLWRDYFRFWSVKHQNRIFQFSGVSTPTYKVHPDELSRFERWKTGTTGIPFVDANMRELNQTGFMSNRGRQNVASFLIHDLQINWLRGAEYFESLLIDYDVYSNYGNWTYLAGVGADPQPKRHFHILKQAKRYDPEGEYVRYWLPELSEVPSRYIHTVFWLPEENLNTFHASHYPRPIHIPSSWIPD